MSILIPRAVWEQLGPWQVRYSFLYVRHQVPFQVRHVTNIAAMDRKRNYRFSVLR